MNDPSTKPAVFLDRDGTLTVDRGYTYRVEDLRLHPRALEGLLLLQERGYLLFIISNQSGIGRGLYTHQEYQAFTDALIGVLAKAGVTVAETYHCPHRPDDGCRCRKPGLLHYHDAVARYGIDTARSFVIGDATHDIEAGKRLGAKTVLVQTGLAGSDGAYDATPDYSAADLFDAAQWIVDGAPV